LLLTHAGFSPGLFTLGSGLRYMHFPLTMKYTLTRELAYEILGRTLPSVGLFLLVSSSWFDRRFKSNHKLLKFNKGLKLGAPFFKKRV